MYTYLCGWRRHPTDVIWEGLPLTLCLPYGLKAVSDRENRITILRPPTKINVYINKNYKFIFKNNTKR